MSEAAVVVEAKPQPDGLDVLLDRGARIQAFLDEYARNANKPHAGDAFKAFVGDLLKQAQAAGLYSPPVVE